MQVPDNHQICYWNQGPIMPLTVYESLSEPYLLRSSGYILLGLFSLLSGQQVVHCFLPAPKAVRQECKSYFASC